MQDDQTTTNQPAVTPDQSVESSSSDTSAPVTTNTEATPSEVTPETTTDIAEPTPATPPGETETPEVPNTVPAEPSVDDAMPQDSSEEEEAESNDDIDGSNVQKTSDVSAARSNSTNQALDLMTIENMINAQMVDIAKLKDDMKIVKDSYDDAFRNDSKYKEFDDKAKEAAKMRNTYKQTLLKDPAVAELSNKLDGFKGEVKDMQEALSDYLREYYRLSGMTQFETKDGEMLQIVNVFKLVKQAK